MIATVTFNPSLDEWVRIPTYREGKLNRAVEFQRYPGGKGVNVSRVVHELGESTIAFALAGGDDGAILRKLMNCMQIPHRFIEVAGATRNNYKIVTQRPQSLTEINTPGPEVSAKALRKLERALLARRPHPQCVALSGSLPPGAPPTIYKRWIHALRKLGVATVLDTSGDALRHGLKERPWLIKPNRPEAEELLGRRLIGPGELVQGALDLLQYGSAHVVLSMGAEGAVLASSNPRGVWLARPPRVKVDSAVGSGDSLVGGFLVGWIKRHSLIEAFKLGLACGTATAMTPGTALCYRSDVRRILKRVNVKQVR